MGLNTKRAGPLDSAHEHAEELERAVRFLVNRGYAVEVLYEEWMDRDEVYGPPPVRVFLEGDDEHLANFNDFRPYEVDMVTPLPDASPHACSAILKTDSEKEHLKGRVEELEDELERERNNAPVGSPMREGK